MQKFIEKILPPQSAIAMQNPFLGVKTLKSLCNLPRFLQKSRILPSAAAIAAANPFRPIRLGLLQKSRKKHSATAQQLQQLLQNTPQSPNQIQREFVSNGAIAPKEFLHAQIFALKVQTLDQPNHQKRTTKNQSRRTNS